jgi:hypothetical protein
MPLHNFTVDARKLRQQGIALSQEGQANVMYLAQGGETAQAEMALLRREVAGARKHIKRLEEAARGKRNKGNLHHPGRR